MVLPQLHTQPKTTTTHYAATKENNNVLCGNQRQQQRTTRQQIMHRCRDTKFISQNKICNQVFRLWIDARFVKKE